MGNSQICGEKNDKFLNNQWVKRNPQRILEYFEMNKNEDAIYQNLQIQLPQSLRRRFIVINAHVKKRRDLKSVTLTFT